MCYSTKWDLNSEPHAAGALLAEPSCSPLSFAFGDKLSIGSPGSPENHNAPVVVHAHQHSFSSTFLVHSCASEHREVKRPHSTSFCSLLYKHPLSPAIITVLEASGPFLGVDTPIISVVFIRRRHTAGANLCTEAWQGRRSHTRQ